MPYPTISDKGDYNIPNLQSATGINANNVSDFGPSSGEVGYAEFVTTRVGMPTPDPNGWKNKFEIVGGLPDCPDPGTSFSIRIYADVDDVYDLGLTTGSYYAQQILSRQQIVTNMGSVNIEGKSYGHITFNGRELDYVQWTVSVPDGTYDQLFLDPKVVDPLNHNAGGMNTGLVASQTDRNGNTIELGTTGETAVTSSGAIKLVASPSQPEFDFVFSAQESSSTGGTTYYDYTLDVTVFVRGEPFDQPSGQLHMRRNGAEHDDSPFDVPSDLKLTITNLFPVIPEESQDGTQYDWNFTFHLEDQNGDVRSFDVPLAWQFKTGQGSSFGASTSHSLCEDGYFGDGTVDGSLSGWNP